MKHPSQNFVNSLLIYTLLLPHARSQRPDYTVKLWQRNKFWWWSSDAPMTKALDELPDVVTGVKMFIDHLERVEKRISSNVGIPIPPGSETVLRPCNSRDLQKWPTAVDSNFGMRGFPAPDLSCVTDFTGVRFSPEEIPPYTGDQLYEAVLRSGLAIQANVKEIASRVMGVGNNFTGPSYVFDFQFSTIGATCTMHPLHAVRAGEMWRSITQIHNRPKDEAVQNGGRQVLVEYHRVLDGHLTDNLLMRLPVYPKNGTKRVFRNDSTTLFINARGPATPSRFRFIPIEENPAIIESLDKANIFIEQAEDAVTPSNIAILVLPLALNLVPVSLFAQVSSIKMLIYILLSDVLTTIPLLIKGIELLQIEQRRHRSIVTRISSSLNSTRSEAAAAEMWAAECQVRDNVRTVGLIFVSVSVALLIGGTMLEILGRRYVQRRKLRILKQDMESTGLSTSEMEEMPSAGLLDSKQDPTGFSESSLSQTPTYYGEFYMHGSGLDFSDSSSYVHSEQHCRKPRYKIFR